MERFGKYRAVVFDINDPEKRGRVKVKCPSILGDATSNWCEALIPNGKDFYIPKAGECVWIEFEQGNVNLPIYTGSWWGKDQIPIDELSGGTRVIEFNGNKIILNNTVTIISQDGTTLSVGGGVCTVNGTPLDFID